jgi:4-amino-4-deoxy-L-arabinose transferase-like glycosyltransferase
MIAYLLRLFTAIFGKNAIAIKLADTTVTGLTVIAFHHLAGKFLPSRKTWMGTILLLSTIMISILSLISTPDVPLLLLWTLSLKSLHGAIFEKKNINWIWAGIFTGLCFDSKYTALFLIIGLVGFLLISEKNRKLLFSKWFIIYLLIFAIMITPVFIWNLQNHFASFKFQSEGRVKEGLQLDTAGFWGVIAHQTAVLLPFLLISLFYFIYRTLRKYGVRFSRIPDDQLFLLSFFIPLFMGFLFISFVYWVKLNWMMPAYITAIIWVIRIWNGKWLRYQVIFSLIVHIILVVEIIFYVVPINSDDTWFGWDQLSAKVENRRKQYPEAFIFSSDDYKTSAILNFYLHEMVYSKNVVGERALQFDFIGTNLKELNGRDAIYIDSNPHFNDLENENGNIPFFFYAYFDRIYPLEPILILKYGRVERKFSVFLCKNYHAKPKS